MISAVPLLPTVVLPPGVKPRILIVEDDPTIREMLMEGLRDELDGDIWGARTAQKAVEIATRKFPHLLLLDYHLPDSNGILLYDYFCALMNNQALAAMMISADVPQALLEERHLINVQKPFDLFKLLTMVRGIFVEVV